MTAYFGGVALDPRVLIARFQQLVNMLPNGPVKSFGYKKKASKAKGTGDQSFEKARPKLIKSGKDPKLVDIYLKSKEPLGHSKKLFRINKGINHDEKALIKDFDAFKKRYIEESTPEKEIMPDKPIKFEKPKKPSSIEELMEEKYSDVETASTVTPEDWRKAIESHELESVVSAEESARLLSGKSKELIDLVAKKYNIKSKDKLPIGFMEAFLAADTPDLEKKVIERFDKELSEIKVKNDADDLIGKKRKLLTQKRVIKEFGKLTQKALKLKMKAAEAAKKAIKHVSVPETIKNELIASTKGKVVLPGPGRGKSKKETIVVKV